MALSEQHKTNIWLDWMTANGAWPSGILQAELRAVVDAIDDYYDANAVAMNTALPQPFRADATVEQKALAFAMVALMRAGKRPRALLRILGEG